MVSSSPLSRPRTPSKSPLPEDVPIPPIPQSEQRGREAAQRRPSFSFLRRGKSQERSNSLRSVSGGKLTKKQQKDLQRQQGGGGIPNQAPKIPDLERTPQLQTFGGENARPGRFSMQGSGYSKPRPLPSGSVDMTRANRPYNVPIPPVPGIKPGGSWDPYARTESMTHRGRYSYASSVVSAINSPRRVRRRKDPTPFNILVVGARNSGKTSFLEFLSTSLALPAKKQRQTRTDSLVGPTYTHINPNYVSHYLETEMDDGERVGLTLWDSEGLEKGIVDLQLRDMSSFVESKFEDTFNEEMKVIRSPGVRDTHIHCVFLILDPSRLDGNIAAAQKARNAANGTLFAKGKLFLQDPETGNPLNALDDDLDLQVLRTLQGKTTVVPVISKADTVTTGHMTYLKRAVWETLKRAALDPLEGLGLEGDDEENVASSEEAYYDIEIPSSPKHAKHDSKRFDERDEDTLLHPSPKRNGNSNKHGNGTSPQRLSPQPPILWHSPTSHLDDPSSSSDSSPARSSFPPALKTMPPQLATQAPSPPPYLPLSIISPDVHDPGTIGRKFPWGFADPYNTEHCDFVRLREAVFKEWRGELREASRELWYEGWRTSRLDGAKAGRGRGVEGEGEGEVGTAR